MELRKMIFEQKQPKVVVCKSGRAMIALNEQVVNATENVPVGMDESGEMIYEERNEQQYEYDVCWLENVGSEEDVLGRAKEAVAAEITAYDSSSAVNGFILNGERVWLSFELRDRVYQGNERLQRIGRTDTTLWLGNHCYNLSIEQAQNILSHIEAYAKDCYNVTAAHKAAVEKLQTVEEVLAYDYTAGYPEMLTMSV